MELSDFVRQNLQFASERDRTFLHMCKVLSNSSYDPSTKCACIIVDEHQYVAGAGVNSIPAKLTACYHSRERKYKRVVHAEMNALLSGNVQAGGVYTCYTWPAMPCADCAKHIIAAGISRVVYPKATDDYMSRWAEACAITIELLDEANVKHTQYLPQEI